MRSRNHKRAQYNRLRWTLFALTMLCLVAVGVGVTRLVLAGTPPSGTLSPATPLITYTGGPFITSNPTSPVGENPPVCSPATPCDEFALTVSIPAGNTTDYSVVITIDWTDSGTTTTGNSASDFDLYIYQPDGITKVAQGPGTSKPEVAIFQALPGNYRVIVVPYDVSPTVPFNGKIELLAAASVVQPTPKPLPQASGSTPRYGIFTPPPSILTRVAPSPAPSPSPGEAPSTPSAGNGTDAGEPSIGVNWKTNRAMYQSSLTTFRVTFDDSCPSSPSALWEDKSAPTAQTSLDPILFTDHGYNPLNPNVGRTITSQLSGTTSLSSVTDNDGDTWIPSQGGGLTSGVDHQGIGAGPYHTLPGGLPFPKLPGAYPNAVYYCSQDIAAANCTRSDDGGVTYGPTVPIYTLAECGGLHGHPKISPDGTVYVPNKGCGTEQAVVTSENNGISWEVRHVPNSGNAGSDPGVGIGRGDKVTGGRVYFAYALNDGTAMVAVSDDHGKPGTWKNHFDVGAAAGIEHSVFPVVVAGDDDRAAMAFIGTAAKGSLDDRAFPGVWYLYIAHTYDGGVTWTTVNATPNDPVQRGGIWLGGGSPPHRNLLDFIGIDVDKDGRVLVGYADGCTGPACVQAPYEATGNSYTALAAIARQTGGKRLFGPDTALTTTAQKPGAPYISVGRDGSIVHLSWSTSDDGGSPITGYKILRGTTSGGETLLATIGNVNKYDDATAAPNTTYYYKVVAVNAQGESCGNNEVAAKPMGDSCSGIREVTDPANDQKGGPVSNKDLDVLEILVADRVEAGQNKLIFKLKVADLSLLVPNRQWRILWNYPIKAANIASAQFTGTYYVGMNSDAGAATFEYGTVTTVEAVPTNTSTPNKIGQADSGSFDPATGIITIVLSASKVGSPDSGDILGSLLARTFAGNGNETVKSQSAIDATGALGTVDPYTGASYMVVGNLGCQSVTPPPTPSLSINDATVTEGNGGTTNATFTVTLSAASTSAVTVKYDTANGTATAGSDYQAASGTLTFTPGQTTQTINVAVNGDTTPESDETFAVNLSQPTNATIADGQGLGTITNDDQPPAGTPQPSLSINDVTVQEGSSGTTNAIFTVTLSAVSNQTVSINFTTADIDATGGVDYQTSSGKVTFAPGETSKTITILVNGDLQVENNETFYVNLSNEVNATVARGQGTGTINNDDPTRVQFDATTYSVSEGAGRFTITVTRTDASVDATVRYSTSDTAGLNNCDVFNNVASQRCDYEIAVGTLRFAAGQTSRTITIPVIDDVYAEGNESFTLTLSSPSGVSLGTNTTSTLTITDNDANSDAPNPIDTTDFFIRQHYLDFLNREPDPNGFQGWRNILNNCAQGDTSCDRIEVSSAFYRSPEFQSRGFFVYSFYVASLGRFPKYEEFMPDMSSVSGFQSQQEEEANKLIFIADFMARPEFKSRYDSKTQARAYVDELEKAAGVTLSNKEQLISDLEQGRKTRAEVLRDVAQSPEVSVKYFNQAFVVMEYFGYLRRNPDALYQHWIDVVTGAPNDYRQMVNGFVNSAEYRSRFGHP